MEYRLATKENLEEIFELVQCTIKTIYPKYYLPQIVDFFVEWHNKERIQKDVEKASTYILIDEGKIVGTGTCDGNHIGRIYLLPEYQGRGYGTYIMNELEETIAKSYSKVLIDASLPACSFYMHRGYKTIDHGIWECEKGVIQVYEIMQKDLKRNSLRLRSYRNCDAKTIVNWCKDEISFRKWCADRYENYPITEVDMNKQYKDCIDWDGFYPMTIFDENGVVGHLIMRFIDEEKTTLRFGFIIVDDTKRGMGYGKEMLQLSLKYAFEILKVSKVTLGVFENNPSAYYCYKAVGFKETEQEEYYDVIGRKWKSIEMEITEKDYKSIK